MAIKSLANLIDDHGGGGDDGNAAAHNLLLNASRGARPASPRSPSIPSNAGRDRDRSSRPRRSEEHTSELQSLMRISYAVFCLKKKKHNMHTRCRITTSLHDRIQNMYTQLSMIY